MKVIIVNDYDEMSDEAAKVLYDVIKNKPDCVLGLATGSTPAGLYERLIQLHQKGKLDFCRVRSVNLDEYYPISPCDSHSFRHFMDTHLFDHINIDKKNTHVPNGAAENAYLACAEYESIINELGGIDIQVLGIGQNGHIGFNEPSDCPAPFTHLETLSESTIKANARFFATIDDVPKNALTMGIQSIFKARKIIILACGVSKAEAVRKMLTGEPTPQCPASLLQNHPDALLICDKDAYSLCK